MLKHVSVTVMAKNNVATAFEDRYLCWMGGTLELTEKQATEGATGDRMDFSAEQRWIELGDKNFGRMWIFSLVGGKFSMCLFL